MWKHHDTLNMIKFVSIINAKHSHENQASDIENAYNQ